MARKTPGCGVALPRRPFPALPPPAPRKAAVRRPGARPAPSVRAKAPEAVPVRPRAPLGLPAPAAPPRSTLPPFPGARARGPLAHLVGVPRAERPQEPVAPPAPRKRWQATGGRPSYGTPKPVEAQTAVIFGDLAWGSAQPGARVRWVPTKPSAIKAGAVPIEGVLRRQAKAKFWSATIDTGAGRVIVWENIGDLRTADGGAAPIAIERPAPPSAARERAAPRAQPSARSEPTREALVVPASSTRLLPKLPKLREFPKLPETPEKTRANEVRIMALQNLRYAYALASAMPSVHPHALAMLGDAVTALKSDNVSARLMQREDAWPVMGPYDVILTRDAHLVGRQVNREAWSFRGGSRLAIYTLAWQLSTINVGAMAEMEPAHAKAARSLLTGDGLAYFAEPLDTSLSPSDAATAWLEVVDRSFERALTGSVDNFFETQPNGSIGGEVEHSVGRGDYILWSTDEARVRRRAAGFAASHFVELGGFLKHAAEVGKDHKYSGDAVDSKRAAELQFAVLPALQVMTHPGAEYFARYIGPAVEKYRPVAREALRIRLAMDRANAAVAEAITPRIRAGVEVLAKSATNETAKVYYTRMASSIVPRPGSVYGPMFYHRLTHGDDHDSRWKRILTTWKNEHGEHEMAAHPSWVERVSDAVKSATDGVPRMLVSAGHPTPEQVALEDAAMWMSEIAHNGPLTVAEAVRFYLHMRGSVERATRSEYDARRMVTLGVRAADFFPLSYDRRDMDAAIARKAATEATRSNGRRSLALSRRRRV